VRFSAVVFDFYGTLAIRRGDSEPLRDILARYGYAADDDAIWRFFNDGIDGTTHHEYSLSRDHYVDWQRARFTGLLRELGVEDEHHEPVNDALRSSWSTGAMEAYPETAEVLSELRRRNTQLVICSNWDWDLREAVLDSGLHDHVDEMVSSAWVGARKPHPHIYERTLELVEALPSEVLFVGDTWNCDVEGPAAVGLTPVYVRRADRDPDHTRPPGATTTYEFADLNGLLDLV
jgi:putative hydrolase of the HAD superfamily